MDYKDYQAGIGDNNFYFKGKKDLIDILFSKLNKRKLKILNIGAGTGNDLEVINKYGDVHVIDIEEKALGLVPDKFCIEKKVCDACSLDYPDSFFDVVISFDVFEHIEDDKSAFSEVYRVLKKGGKLIFTVPAYQTLFSAHDKALGHYRRYDKKLLKNILFKFDNKELSYWNSFLFLPISVMRFFKRKKKAKVDNFNLPNLLNKFCYHLLFIENSFIKRGLNLPFGLTLWGISEKR